MKKQDTRSHSEMYVNVYLTPEQGEQIPVVLEYHGGIKLSKFLRMKVAEEFNKISQNKKA